MDKSDFGLFEKVWEHRMINHQIKKHSTSKIHGDFGTKCEIGQLNFWLWLLKDSSCRRHVSLPSTTHQSHKIDEDKMSKINKEDSSSPRN
jgi:hypothetical protein